MHGLPLRNLTYQQHPKTMTDFTSIRKTIAAHLLLMSAMWHLSATSAYAQANGTLDPNFNTTGYNINDISGNSTADAAVGLALMSNGRYFVAGYAGPSGSIDRKFGLARYAADGGLQASAQRSFPVGLNIMNPRACAKDPLANAFYVAGMREISSNKIWVLGLYREDLTSETQYGSGSTQGYAQTLNLGGADSDVGGMATQPDGKVVLAGYVDGNIAVARYTTTGQLDNTFSSDGYVVTDVPNGTDEKVNAVAVAPDGGIIVAGELNTTPAGFRGLVGRYNANGDIDFSFGTNGFTSINYTGSLAPGGWGIGGNTRFYGITIQPDGKIVLVGRAENTAGDEVDYIIARLNANGSMDASFGTSGLVKVGFAPNPPFFTDIARCVTLDNSGAIIVAGTVSTSGGGIGLVRVLGNGAIDTNFGSSGSVVTNLGSLPSIGGIVMDGQKLVIAGGVMTGAGSSTRNTFIARYFNSTVGILEFSQAPNIVNVFPNPINEAVTFEYTLQDSERLTIALHDLQGKVITTFLDGKRMPAGEHRQTVAMPADLASGNYLLVFSGEKGRMSMQVSKQ